MAEFGFEAETMVPNPAGAAAARTMFETEDGILECYGTTVPTNGTAGYSPSCCFRKIDGSTLDTIRYYNIGSNTSCNFDAAVMAS